MSIEAEIFTAPKVGRLGGRPVDRVFMRRVQDLADQLKRAAKRGRARLPLVELSKQTGGNDGR